MKKSVILLFLALQCLFVLAQNKQSLVIFKNGTEIKGQIKSIDPSSDIIISIAGIDTSFKFADVAKIEELDNGMTPKENSQNLAVVKLNNDDKLVVTDHAEYPDSFELKIGSETLTMILVRGGFMNMGWDGIHSWRMNSEPIRKVGLTSFYMAKEYVSSKIAHHFDPKVKVKKPKKNKPDYYPVTYNWNKAQTLAEAIAKETNLPVRIPTEAEWEYAASSEVQDVLFTIRCEEAEFCSDFWRAEYLPLGANNIDPKGPATGFHRIIRCYSSPDGKYDRSGEFGSKDCYLRLVVKAKDYLEHNTQ